MGDITRSEWQRTLHNFDSFYLRYRWYFGDLSQAEISQPNLRVRILVHCLTVTQIIRFLLYSGWSSNGLFVPTVFTTGIVTIILDLARQFVN